MMMNCSDLLLVASGTCWGACFLLFFAQLLASQIHQLSALTIAALCFSQLALVLGLPLLSRLLFRDAANHNRRWYDYVVDYHRRKLAVMSGTLSVAEFLVLLSPFIFLINRTSTHHDRRLSRDMIFALALLDVGGHVVLFLIKYFRSCYGLFMSIVAGVVCTSYKGFGHGDRHVYKVFIILLSLVMVLFCGTFLSVQDEETAQAAANPGSNAAQRVV